MNISSKTKISVILKANEKAVEVIASINRHFLKLKNPVLREALAPRVTVEQAAKIGKVDPEVILNRLKDIGFEIVSSYDEKTNSSSDESLVTILPKDQFLVLDVRSIIDSGKDPFPEIMRSLKIAGEKTLLIINSFEPIPLLEILRRKGFDSIVEKKDKNLFFTYLKKADRRSESSDTQSEEASSLHSWEMAVSKYEKKLIYLDVKGLEMPWPMIHILSTLSEMDPGYALMVHHRKIPVILLPQLKERGYQYRIKEDGTTIQLLLFKEK
jgi:hypothetical protein